MYGLYSYFGYSGYVLHWCSFSSILLAYHLCDDKNVFLTKKRKFTMTVVPPYPEGTRSRGSPSIPETKESTGPVCQCRVLSYTYAHKESTLPLLFGLPESPASPPSHVGATVKQHEGDSNTSPVIRS